MKSKLFLLFTLAFLSNSCSKQDHYSAFETFGEDNHWNQTDSKTFTFDITNETLSYDIAFKFSHVYDYQFASVPVQFVLECPNGTKETLNVDLKIKDATGKQLADCSGDVCDLIYKIKEKTKLTQGNYKVTISHHFKGAPYLPNVLGIGLNVDSVK